MKEHTGKVVRFSSNNGNEFRMGDLAICMNGESGLFLGLSGDNFMRMWYESGKFKVMPTLKPEIEELLSKARCKYFE
ncbi:hypothetical protein H6F38_13980 [Paenibacillus sp. EKM208P]|nr:hypothetical protein H6F38_13980 [Paenibacillus sp. EKM208P]